LAFIIPNQHLRIANHLSESRSSTYVEEHFAYSTSIEKGFTKQPSLFRF